MGWANHPGAGGPYTLPGGTVPKDAARPYLFGWEFEGGVREADWTDSMRNFMGRCHAGTLDWLGRGSGSHIEHKTWAPTRKIDRLRYTLADARAEIRRQPRLDPPEDDMFTDNDRAKLDRLISVITSFSDDKIDRPDAEGTAGMRFALQETWHDTHELTEKVPWQSPGAHDYARDVLGWKEAADPTKARPQETRYLIEWAFVNSDRIWKTISNPKALAEALAPLLPDGSAPTQEQLEAALKNVLGSLDDAPA
jgi:hypothetical protein